MKRLMAITLLAAVSLSAVADEAPLGLDTPLVGEVTIGQSLLIGSAAVAGLIALNNSGGGSNGNNTTGTTGTTGTGN